jgi:replicative DNA helicase
LDLCEARSPVDVLTVSDALKKKKALKKVGGSGYLTELVNRVPTAAHVEHYAKIVKDQALKRSLMSVASRLFDSSLDEGTSVDDLMDKAEMEIYGVTQSHVAGSFTSVKKALADSFDRLDELHKAGSGIRGVPTGFGS